MKDYNRIASKITAVLFLSQSLSSAGFIAAFTVNALVAVDLTGRAAMAGVPGALYVLGQACGAVVWGFTMERIGRRWGIAVGQVIEVHTTDPGSLSDFPAWAKSAGHEVLSTEQGAGVIKIFVKRLK